MAKIIDITDKLNFEQKPQLKIKDVTVTVNNEAVAILKVLPKLSGEVTPETVNEIYDILFDSSEQEKLAKLKLNFSDFIKLVESAAELVAGDAESGEAATPAMT